jgi:hypothetical protein
VLELRDNDGGALVVRRARKSHRCEGDGSAADGGRHADGCAGTIEPGEQYLEVLWSAPAYAAGGHVCERCARAYYWGWLEV